LRKAYSAKTPLYKGAFASLLLFILYLGVLSISNSFSHALTKFKEMWYWFTPLIAGFGVQVGLYSFIKQKQKKAVSRGVAAVSGGVSTTSMIACCAHHLTDILPLLGVSAAALFLAKYQTLFILIGILSNLVGIILLLRIIQTHRIGVQGVLSILLKLNMRKALYGALSLSSVAIIIFLKTGA